VTSLTPKDLAASSAGTIGGSSSGHCFDVRGCSRRQLPWAIYGFHFRQVIALRVG
jgi:hypothetical protein